MRDGHVFDGDADVIEDRLELGFHDVARLRLHSDAKPIIWIDASFLR